MAFTFPRCFDAQFRVVLKSFLVAHLTLEAKRNYSTRQTQCPAVFLILSGHVYPNGTYQTRVENREKIMFERQDADNGMEAAAARIMTFGLKEQTVFVNTFATYAQSGFLNGTAKQFSFSVNLKTDPSLQGPPY
jgi:hypothetical protein